MKKNNLTLKEKCERWYRRYIVLRLKNPVFVSSLLTVLFGEICSFNKILPTSIMSWGDLTTIISNLALNPAQFFTMAGTVVVSFINPILRGAGDGKEITDERLKELEEKMNGETTPIVAPVPPGQIPHVIVDAHVSQQNGPPQPPPIVEIVLTKK